jgi:hypothetical protein
VAISDCSFFFVKLANMNAHFECSVMYDEVNAAAFTFCLIENICGSWYNVGDHVSDFGEIKY